MFCIAMRNLQISLHAVFFVLFLFFFAAGVAEEAFKDGVRSDNEHLGSKFYACFFICL